jgi:hypothetical protein
MYNYKLFNQMTKKGEFTLLNGEDLQAFKLAVKRAQEIRNEEVDSGNLYFTELLEEARWPKEARQDRGRAIQCALSAIQCRCVAEAIECATPVMTIALVNMARRYSDLKHYAPHLVSAIFTHMMEGCLKEAEESIAAICLVAGVNSLDEIDLSLFSEH